MKHTCIRSFGFNVADDVGHPFYNIYPLKFEPNYNESYFNDLGLKSVGGRVILSPASVEELFTNHTSNTTTYFPGKTLVPNCYWQGWNPAHFIFGIGVLYEWSISKPEYVDSFDQLMLLRCDCWYRALHQWPWGLTVFEAALGSWKRKGLFSTKHRHSRFGNVTRSNSARDDPSASYYADSHDFTTYDFFNRSQAHVHPFPYQSTPQSPYLPLPAKQSMNPFPHVFSPYRATAVQHYYCFEDLYVIQRWGVLMESKELVTRFRRDLLHLLTWKRMLERDPTLVHSKEVRARVRETSAPSRWLPDEGLETRCATRSLSLVLQLRPQEYSRRMLNADEVIRMLAKHSTKFSKMQFHSLPLEEQMEAYNSFDVLITMTGSHLTNLMFTNRSSAAIIETGLALRDTFWKENAHTFGLKHYEYQHVGNTPSDECYRDGKVDSRCAVAPDDPTGMKIVCPPSGPTDLWNQIGDCDFNVSVPMLEQQLLRVISRLCPTSSSLTSS